MRKEDETGRKVVRGRRQIDELEGKEHEREGKRRRRTHGVERKLRTVRTQREKKSSWIEE